MEKAYNPKDFESEIYQRWEAKGLFNPDNIKSRKKESYSIVLPPPNVTGVLHLGHALMLAIEDLFVRYKRMQGFDTLWVPGTDHAAIATQNVVEKKLFAEQKKTRHDLGREKFLGKVEEFVDESKETIHKQIRLMGASMDWSREAYTLDETRTKAVRKVFKKMYEDDLIYRGYRIVNWCPRCQTTLADDEIDHKEVDTKIYTFKYSKDFPFSIATTRPETKLGDTAVAVNPDDERYKEYIGKNFIVNFCGLELNLKVIGDKEVDPEFGTGALGVTPAHSSVDYHMAQKNDLNIIKVINEDGVIGENINGFAGLTVQAARGKVVECLDEKGLMEKVEDMKHNLSLCYRCKTAVEPLTSQQWFVDVNKKFEIKNNVIGGFEKGQMTSLKELSLAVVKNKDIEIIPAKFEKVYYHWMESLHDWCISRQIWFGHQIPVWYRKSTELVCVRHGESENNVQGYMNGDIANNHFNLTDRGRLQVKEAARKMAGEKFDLIFSSDFLRTKQTAEILKEELGIEAGIVFDERLREVGMGNFEGLHDGELSEYRTNNFSEWENEPAKGLEPWSRLYGRVMDFINDMKEKYPGKKILVVSHGDPLRYVQAYGKSLTPEQSYNLGYPGNARTLRLSLAPDNEPNRLELSFRHKKIFEAIKNGLKTIETRALNPEEPYRYFGDIKAGDEIVLNYKQGDYILESLTAKVKRTNKYDDLKSMIDGEDQSKVLSEKTDDPESAWNSLAPNYLKKINKNGIVAIHLAKVKPFNKNITMKVSETDIKEEGWVQDEDTLDTWFSSGLWTFSTMLPKDWNGKKFVSKDLKRFHPNAMMETGHDILFFWVARMILMTTYTLEEIPFEKVYLHGMIKDINGDKMSKSNPETSVDPIDVGDKYGYDAVRLSMLIGNTAGNDMRMSDEKVEGYRNFVNKLWNISRYIIDSSKSNVESKKKKADVTLADRWLLSRFNRLKKDVTKLMDEHNFSLAGEKLKDFTWNEFADWYLEISKVEKGKDNLLINVLTELLQLWHPFIPFVTTAIWENLDQKGELMISEWPDVADGLIDESAEKEFEQIREIIVKIRNLRAEYKVDPGKKVNLAIQGGNKGEEAIIKSLARLESIDYVSSKPDKSASAVIGDVQIYLPLADLLDLDKEKERLASEKENIEKYIAGLEKKLGNKQFVDNAPEKVVEEEKKKQTEAVEKLGKINLQLKELK